MAANYGLIDTMASGIREGLLAYQQKKQGDQQSQMMQLAYGIQPGPDGTLQYTPEKQAELSAQKAADTAKQKGILADYDVASPNEQSTYKAHLKMLNPNDNTDVSQLTHHQLVEGEGLIDKDVAGHYAVEAGKQKALAAGQAAAIGRNTSIDSREKQMAERTFNNDSLIKTYSQRADGATKILDLIDKARQNGDVKSTQAVLGQLNAEIARLETGSQSPGLNASEKTEMNDTAARYHNILDTLSGNVTGVDLSKKFDQASGMVKELGGSYARAINDRSDVLSAGGTENQTSVFDAKRGILNKKYGSRFSGTPQGGLLTGPQQQAPTAPKAGDIMDGHKFKGGNPADQNNWEKI